MLRPMSCPHHFELYLSKPRSYKDLPIRFAELAKQYRFEQSGELMGLQRTRSFCLADAHIICRPTQAAEEVDRALDLIDRLAAVLGLSQGKDYWYRLSLGDRSDDKKYYKDDAAWDEAENLLRQALQGNKAKFIEAEHEAAFYGPKIDIQMKNVNSKEDTAFTVQYDFVMPKRFALNYTNEKGQDEQAVVIHRSSIGAIERLVAFLIEYYGGAFPTWLAPVQAIILPVSDKQMGYAQKVFDQLKIQDIRVELDSRNEPLPARVRDAELQKVPYILVVGNKEAGSDSVSVRKRHTNVAQVQKLPEFSKNITQEISARTGTTTPPNR